MPRMARSEWRNGSRCVLKHEGERRIDHQFERREARACPIRSKTEKRKRRRRTFQPDPSHLATGRLRVKLHHGCRDDAQCAFRTYEQVLEVVARVVLLELAQIIEHFSCRQDDLDAETKFACIAVGKDARTACV